MQSRQARDQRVPFLQIRAIGTPFFLKTARFASGWAQVLDASMADLKILLDRKITRLLVILGRAEEDHVVMADVFPGDLIACAQRQFESVRPQQAGYFECALSLSDSGVVIDR